MVVRYRFRLFLLALLMLGGFSLLVYRLHYLQVVKADEFRAKVPGQKQLTVRVPGVRGEIRDRNGISLVGNRSSFEVRINLKDVMDEYKRQIRLKDSAATVPKVSFKYMDKDIQRERKEDDIVAVFKEMIVDKLNAMGLAGDFAAEQDLRVHYRSYGGSVPWVYREGLTFEEFARFAEHNLGLPGVSVAARPVRQYMYQSLACHLLGFVRLADEQRATVEEKKGWDYYVPDDYGVSGVEKTFDKYLVGRPGVRTMLKNEKGAIVGQVSYEPPRKGFDVHLTIDARIQMIAEKALRDAKLGRASCVVIEPNTGEILAMASLPSYDPNKFVPSISEEDFAGYNQNPTTPLINRALAGFPPGSTYKIMTALSGCLAGISAKSYFCGGSVTYGNKAMQCWIQRQSGGSHGSLDLSSAIKQSCNCFFYQYGNGAGIRNMEKMGHMMGLGKKTGVELDEEDPSRLILPGPSWMRLNRPRENAFSPGLIANASIGQGYVLASPLQMANVAATVANGGRAFPPHLLKRVQDGDVLVKENKPDPVGDLVQLGVEPKQIELVRRGMWKVVNEAGGTAKAARIDNVEVAGKTGTAQAWRYNEKGQRRDDNHTWFISFAPYQNPKYAICIMIQNAKSGGGTAAPVARRVLEQALALDNGYQVAVEAMEEVKGDFNYHDSISYSDQPLIAQASDDDDGDVGSQSEARQVDDEPRRTTAVPSIRKKADAAGTVTPQNKEAPKAIPVKRSFFRNLFRRGD
jgi:penicillin-binding protein 2